MKLLNKALCLVALFSMGSALAKISGGAAGRPGYTGGNAPYAGGGAQEKFLPIKENIEKIRRGTYSLLNKNVPNRIVFNQQILSTENFVKQNNLDSNIFEFFLKLSRDKDFQFTGNDAKDLALLEDSNKQINFLVENFGKIDLDKYQAYLRNNPLK
jgi:hypothetical protein